MADIELIIKIPEEVYKSIIKGKNYISYQEYVEESIKNGTPLPKGRGDLVDRNDLDGEWICTYDGECVKECPCDKCSFYKYKLYNIMDVQTIIEADKGEENV